VKGPELDLLITGAEILDVFRLRAFQGWLGIRGGRFIYVEPGEPPRGVPTRHTVEACGALITPGLIDAHMHIESTLLSPRRFAEGALPHGTTCVLADPHEIASVAGEEGIRWMMQAAAGLSLRVYFAIPSCVPPTSARLETTGAEVTAELVRKLAGASEVIALGEVMDYRGLVAGDERLRGIIGAAASHGLLIEGHVPSLLGTELSEYLSYGITSDHTLMRPEKILELVGKGAALMLQLKSLAPENIAAVLDLPDRSRVMLVTDDVDPARLRTEGHLSSIVKAAMARGVPWEEAFSMATLRPATYLGLRRMGAIAPGWTADFLVLEGPGLFPPRTVYVGGRKVAEEGELIAPVGSPGPPLPSNLCYDRFVPEDFLVKLDLQECLANVVSVQSEDNTLTDLERVPVRLKGGRVVLGPEDDLALIAVFSRDGSSRSTGVVKDLGLKRGAFASTFSHDAHNLLVVGRSPEAMALAASRACEGGGGIAVADEGGVIAHLPLPIAGILTDAPLDAVASSFNQIEDSLRRFGMRHARPFLLLSTLTLSVSPRYKFSDKGVVDVEARRLIPPFINP